MPKSNPSTRPRRVWPRRVLLGLLVGLVSFVGVQCVRAQIDPAPPAAGDSSRHEVVALFGGSGTVGNGVLKALLEDPGVTKVYAVTRRVTPRMEAGVQAGKLEVVKHTDYMDYAALEPLLPEVDAVYWALGISATKVDDAKYTEIHVDFPLAFVDTWIAHAGEGERSFHLVTGQGTSEDSWQHWAREKARAEQEVNAKLQGTPIRAVHYRPTYVTPAVDDGSPPFSYTLLHPIGGATESTDIGRAMLEVTARGAEALPHGTVLENLELLRYAAARVERG